MTLTTQFTTQTYIIAILLMTLVCPSKLLNAQTTHAIHGQVLGTDGKPVTEGTIILQNTKDSIVIATGQTNDSGNYTIAATGNDRLQLKVMAPGYNAQTKLVPQKTSGSTVINFILNKERTLKEVTITSRKPVIEEKIDRTVFNVENSITAIGGNALDALKKTPGVQVMNNEISIAGKGSVSVMINGRLQQLSGSELTQLLQTMPSDNLSRIEVITAPPAKYDAEGNSGIINLVTKKNQKQGFRGSATASYLKNVMGSPALSTNLAYRHNKLNLFCNANAGVFAWKYTGRVTNYYPTQRWDQRLDQYSYNKNATIQIGADYSLNKGATLGFQFADGISKINNTEGIGALGFSEGNKLDSTIYTNGISHELYKGKYTLNVNYEWKIDTTGKKLNVDADYYEQAAQKGRSYNVRGSVPGMPEVAGTSYQQLANPSINIRSVKADVEWPIRKLALSFGGKAAFVANTAENIFKTFDGNEYTVDAAKTNTFSYKEQTQAMYVSGRGNAGRFDLQFGLRGEHTRASTYSPTTKQSGAFEYTQLFPSAYLQYKLKENNAFTINFTRRINRPGYSLLNPFRFYYSSNTYTVGNPGLQPSFNNGLEFGYRWRSRYSLKLFARQTDNYWDRIYETDTITGFTKLTRANIGRARNCGININGQVDITKWWQGRGSINGAYSHFLLDHFNSVTTLSGLNAWFETGHSFFLNKSKTLSAEIDAYYYTPRQKDYKKWGEMSCINIGIKALLLENNLIIALNMEDLMARAYWQQTNVYNGATEYSYDNSQGGTLSVTYKFGNKNVKARRERATSTEEIQRVN